MSHEGDEASYRRKDGRHWASGQLAQRGAKEEHVVCAEQGHARNGNDDGQRDGALHVCLMFKSKVMIATRETRAAGTPAHS